MIVDCIECGARFRVDPQYIGPRGRKVCCSACGFIWHQGLDSNIADSTITKARSLEDNPLHDRTERVANHSDLDRDESREHYDQIKQIENDLNISQSKNNEEGSQSNNSIEDFFNTIDETLNQDNNKAKRPFYRTGMLALLACIFIIIFTSSIYFLSNNKGNFINSFWTTSTPPLSEIFVLDSDKPIWNQVRQDKRMIRTVVISGSLTNISEKFQQSPEIRMELLDKTGSVIPNVSVTLPLVDKEFAPGERQKFQHIIKDLHSEASEVILSLER